jgi:membrane-bound lytic murein transglycosylase
MLEVKARAVFFVAAPMGATILHIIGSNSVNLSDGRLIMRRTCFSDEQMHRKIAATRPSATLASCS